MMVKIKNFGELLLKHRKAVGLTQQELAKMAGVSKGGISLIERGLRMPSLLFSKKLSLALGVDLESLVSIKGETMYGCRTKKR